MVGQPFLLAARPTFGAGTRLRTPRPGSCRTPRSPVTGDGPQQRLSPPSSGATRRTRLTDMALGDRWPREIRAGGPIDDSEPWFRTGVTQLAPSSCCRVERVLVCDGLRCRGRSGGGRGRSCRPRPGNGGAARPCSGRHGWGRGRRARIRRRHQHHRVASRQRPRPAPNPRTPRVHLVTKRTSRDEANAGADIPLR